MAHAARLTPHQNDQGIAANHPATVLVIDDDAVDRENLRRMLDKAGYAVLQAPNAEEGLQLVAEEAIDCVLLDYFIPGTHGINILETIRKVDKSLPVIMITGQGDEMIAVDAMKHGAVDYLPKDDLTQTLLETIVSQEIGNAQQSREAMYQKFQLENYSDLLAHEIKEPLRTIRSHLRIVRSRCSDALGAVGRDHLLRVSELLSELDTRIASASKDMAPLKQGETSRALKLKFILRSAIDAVEKELTEKNLSIDYASVPDIKLSQQFGRLFHGLFAVYAHLSPAQKIVLQGEKKGDNWCFVMTPETNTAVDYSPKGNLQQLVTTLNDKSPEYAMSLRLCKNFLEAAGGKIWCSTTDRLDQVYFTIPMKATQHKSHQVMPH